VLEHHVDPLALRQPAHLALEPFGAVVDDVIGAERLGLRALFVVADGGDDRAADRLCHLDGGRADAGTAGVDQHRFARLQPRIVEQHVLDGAEGDGRAGGVLEGDTVGHRDDEAGLHVHGFAREAVEVESHDPSHVLAQIVAALAAGPAHAAGLRPVHDDLLPRREPRHALTEPCDFARGFGADDERQLALGEGHAAKAPHVDVVEADCAHADLHFARTRRRRRLESLNAEVPIAEKLERAHQVARAIAKTRRLTPAP
jgi:hypothetical protein